MESFFKRIDTKAHSLSVFKNGWEIKKYILRLKYDNAQNRNDSTLYVEKKLYKKSLSVCFCLQIICPPLYMHFIHHSRFTDIYLWHATKLNLYYRNNKNKYMQIKPTLTTLQRATHVLPQFTMVNISEYYMLNEHNTWLSNCRQIIYRFHWIKIKNTKSK